MRPPVHLQRPVERRPPVDPNTRAEPAVCIPRIPAYVSWKDPSLYIFLGLSNIVPLLVELAQFDRDLVTDELAETLNNVWSAVCEDAQEVADGERLRRVQAYIDWTGEVLEALKAVMEGRPVDASTYLGTPYALRWLTCFIPPDQKPRMKRPKAQFDTVKTPSSPRFAAWTRRRTRLLSI